MTDKKKTLIVKAGRVLLPGGFQENSAVIIENGIISDIVPAGSLANTPECDVLDVRDMNMVPGYCDLHVHGGAGSDFMDASSGALSTAAEYHAAGGTTSLLATTACASENQIIAALEAVSSFDENKNSGARITGVHLEGPYFNPDKKGCHLAEAVRNPDKRELEKILGYSRIVRRMTIAPELPGAKDAIQMLRRHEVVVSPGHSMASFSLMKELAGDGPLHVTHMYCAMSDVIKHGYTREGGIVQAVLLLDSITTEVIADGKHLPDELLALTIKVKGYENVCLCTDAMRGAGMPDGIYAFGPEDGARAKVRNGEAVTLDESGFASSVVRMNDLVKYMVQTIGIPAEQAFFMAGRVPARIIGMDDIIGSIAKNKYADFLILSPDLSIQEVWKKGVKIVHL